MKVRHFLSIADLQAEEVLGLIDRGVQIATGQMNGARPLAGKVAGIYFRRSSTRTRSAFSVGAMQLGANIISYGPNDLQIITGETIQDTARVLSGFLDALVVRTNESLAEMQVLAQQERMAVINAMSENEHPSQAIADLVTVRQVLGRLDDVHILYVGEGNNTAASLALAVSLIPGMGLTLVTPEGYGLSSSVLEMAHGYSLKSGSFIEQHHRVDKLPKGVDVVYTTRWQTMGDPKPDLNWRDRFDPYRVTQAMMAEVSKPSGTVFLHDLPAMRGQEVLDEVLDGPQSYAFLQARNKLTSAMAILEWCAGAGH